MVKKILVVDDSRVSRMMTKALLNEKAPGWEVMEASNGEEALSVARSEKPSAFSIDFNMPGMDGLMLAEMLKNEFPNAKMVLLTANLQKSVQERADEAGLAVISKPVTEQAITLMVEQICD